MQGPVITVDVSKGSCHYQPYVSNGHPMRKPKVLHDTVEGFQSLSDLIDTMKDRYKCETIPVSLKQQVCIITAYRSIWMIIRYRITSFLH